MFLAYLLRRLALWSALLLLGLGIWIGVHASSEGLAEGWRKSVRREFARQGIMVSMGKLTLDPLHGLVARDVRIYDDPEQTRVLADISRVDLDVSLPKLMQGEVFLNSLHVREAQASLPVDPDNPKGERLEIADFYARVMFAGDSVELQDLRGRVFGVLCSVRGELVRRQGAPRKIGKKTGGFGTGGWREMTADQREMLRRVVASLSKLTTERGAPAELRIRASADMGRLEEGQYSFTFRAPVIAWEGLRAEEVSIRGSYENGLLQAEDIRFRDQSGTFRAEADFVRSSRTLRFNIESHAAMVEAARRHWWPAHWPEIAMEDPPVLTAGGRLVFEKGNPWPKGLVTGSAALGRFRVGEARFEYASANVAFDGTRVFLRDVRAAKDGGKLQADVLLEGKKLQARGQASLHPEDVAGFAPPGYVRRLLSAFDCGANSVTGLGFAVSGDFADRRSWAVDTDYQLKDIRFHGVPISSVAGGWKMEPGGRHVFAKTRLEIPRGAPLVVSNGQTSAPTIATVERITLQVPAGTTWFEGVRCQGWPHTVMAAIVPDLMKPVPVFHLEAPADLTVEGVLGGKSEVKSDLRLEMRSAGLLRWPAFDRELPLGQPVVSAQLKGQSAIVSSLSGTFFGGKAAGNLRFDGLGTGRSPSSSGTLSMQDVGYQQLMGLFSQREDKAVGTLDIGLTFRTKDMSMATLDGDGSMRLVNGDLFSIPLFGPLSPLVEAVLPNLGLGYSVASTATATCRVRQGVMTTEDFKALTPAFKMDGHGTIDLRDNSVEFFARLNARGLAQLATVVFSYIFEYKCEGTLGAPQWRPLRIPKIPLPKIPLPRLPGLPGRDKKTE